MTGFEYNRTHAANTMVSYLDATTKYIEGSQIADEPSLLLPVHTQPLLTRILGSVILGESKEWLEYQ
jgi:hypothetical protein